MNSSLKPRVATSLFFLALTLVLIPASPAQAQSASASASPNASASPGTVQYQDSFGSAAAGVAGANNASDAGDIPPAFSKNVTNGAEAVNDAMADEAPAAEASASTGSAPSSSASAGAVPADAASAGAAAEDLKVLPETGGASSLALGSGVLLVAGGLCARRMLRQ